MATPLLKTKLYIPSVRPELVSRPRLIERLEAGMAGKLILISAPAGFGKTTLLSEWVASCGRPVVWVSLDKADNHPAQFWAYVIGALQTAHSNVGEAALAAFQSPQLAPVEIPLTSLINEVAEITDPFALVLDDFHMITDRQVHDGVAFLVDNLPPQMHLVISTRVNPPWPLARLRARREITELRADDLRFTPTEAAAFLNDAMGLGLSAEDIAALDARTEGWIAGLQMAALSMQGREDVAAFVKDFSGSHRFVLDYLLEEVLDSQSNEIQEFLHKTSILDRLAAPLCDAVTGRDDSQAILIQLEQANLFLVPLDEERRWYRYHRLFADLLRSRMEQTQADQVPALHREASRWYEANGMIPEAVSHALAAGDVDGAARLAERNALAMMDHGELTALAGWLNAVPEEVLRSRPWLCVARAWPLAYAGQLDAVEPLLQRAERALAANGPVLPVLSAAEGSAAERQRIVGHIVAIRSLVLGARGDVSRAAELAREALERLPERDLMARGWAAYHLGFMLRMGGDLTGAAQVFVQAAGISQAAGDSHVTVLVLCELAVLQSLQGHLHKAAATYRRALELADKHAGRGGRRLPATGHAFTRMSGLLREWNDLEAALRQAKEGVDLCRQWGQADGMLEGCIHLARVLQATGDVHGALNAIQEAKQVASDVSPWFVVYTEAYEAQLRIAQGDVAAASRWARKSGLSVEDELTFQRAHLYRTLARVLITQGRLDDALGLLARLLEVLEAAGAVGSAIEILVLQAMALQAQGEGDQALTALERALSLAESQGFVRVFIDEGAPMAELLGQAAARGIAVDYVSRLLAGFESEVKDEWRLTEPAALPLAEPLSERELEVLRLLATRLSGPEIAEELVIAVSTLRSHTKSIYSKLNVHRRLDAVERAKELRLI